MRSIDRRSEAPQRDVHIENRPVSWNPHLFDRFNPGVKVTAVINVKRRVEFLKHAAGETSRPQWIAGGAGIPEFGRENGVLDLGMGGNEMKVGGFQGALQILFIIERGPKVHPSGKSMEAGPVAPDENGVALIAKTSALVDKGRDIVPMAEISSI